MSKLKLWTIFYPTGKKDLIVDLSKIKNGGEKEHWKLLSDEVSVTLDMISYPNFKNLDIGGEQAYVNYIVAGCVNQHIPILQYVEESGYWMMFLPEATVKLETQQYRDIFD